MYSVITRYVVEGPKETLQRIEQAITKQLDPTLNVWKRTNHTNDWMGHVINNISDHRLEKSDIIGRHMESYFTTRSDTLLDIDKFRWENDTLRFSTEDLFGVSDFYKVLKEKLPDIKVYWYSSSWADDYEITNDKERKYFPKYHLVSGSNPDLEISIKLGYDFDIYCDDLFTSKENIYKWLSDHSNGKIKSEEDVNEFNHISEGDYEAECENFIDILEIKAVD